MAGPINQPLGPRSTAPVRPGASVAPSVDSGSPAPQSSPAIGRDSTQLSGTGPLPKELPDLRAQTGEVSLDALMGAIDSMPSGRTAADARQGAEQIWHEPENLSTYAFQHVERNAFNVNEDMGPGATERAQGQLKANHDLEAEALTHLSPKDRAAYDDLSKHTAKDPQARLALQLLLVEGKLTGGPQATGGHTLLESLHDVATKPMLKGLARDKVVSDLVQEVALPTAIAQGNHGTCTVTSVQIKLARENPAEYARLVGGFASPEGKVTLANGDVVGRDPGSEKASMTHEKRMAPDGRIFEVPVPDPRTDSSRLFQSALMQYGVGPKVAYDPVKDTVSDERALGPELVQKVMAGISNTPVDYLFTDGVKNDGTRVDLHDQVLDRIASETAKGNSVPVGLAWGEADATGRFHGFHAIDVTKVTGDRVFYNNPWGKQESMTRDQFRERVRFGQVGSFEK